jgi:hypothetical protein
VEGPKVSQTSVCPQANGWLSPERGGVWRKHRTAASTTLQGSEYPNVCVSPLIRSRVVVSMLARGSVSFRRPQYKHRPVTVTRWLAVLALGVTLAACESDAKKLERLERDHAGAFLDELRWRQMADSAGPFTVESTPERRALEDSLSAAEIRLQLARRDLSRFMRGD